MGTVLSDKITVFPSARRGAKYPESRQMSEKAFTSIVNRFMEYDSFIINYTLLKDSSGIDTEYIDTSKPISFNIHGYYFYIDKVEDLPLSEVSTTTPYMYVNIEVVKTGNYEEIWGQDEDGKYQGLKITFGSDKTGGASPEHGGTIYSKNVLFKDANGWKLVEGATFRFTAKTINFTIDGGEF